MSDISKHPDCVETTCDDFLTDQQPQAFSADGVQYVPAKRAMAAQTSDVGDDERAFVTVLLSSGRVGFFQSWTSEGARAFAASLVRIADFIDAQVEQQATEALNKARGK